VLIEVSEVRLDDAEVSATDEGAQPLGCGCNGCGILVDAGDARSLLEEDLRVSSSSERAVQDVPSVAEQLGNLAGEYGGVKRDGLGWVGHRFGDILTLRPLASQVLGGM
jgi:hypothetical protein